MAAKAELTAATSRLHSLCVIFSRQQIMMTLNEFFRKSIGQFQSKFDRRLT